MAYDLRTASWLPLRSQGGGTRWGTIASIVGGPVLESVVAVASPRQDFDGAVTEFLIGLLTAAFKVEDEDEWRELWESPPSEAELQLKLDSLPDAFDLDGDGPRFLQDFAPADLADQAVLPIQELLVNAKNSGLFIKPDTVGAMSRPAAAMALITMQAYSTAGGSGYRTSLRGGGPLTTLVDPRSPDQPDASLWRLLWANVETMEQLATRAGDDGWAQKPSGTFPWLGPTRTSGAENGSATTPSDAHALQVYFGMPRRIRLEFSNRAGTCDVTGRPDDRMVLNFRGRKHGVEYKGWRHPLSPYYPGKKLNELLPVHAQPGGVGWRDWLPLLHASDSAPGKAPALAVAHFGARRANRLGLNRHAIRVFGYDASNAKIRAWISATLPAFAPTEPERLSALMSTVRALVEATDTAASVLQASVANALHARGEDTPGDLTYVKTLLWQATEGWFYTEIAGLMSAADIEAAGAELRAQYAKVLADHALRAFDTTAPSDATNAEVLRRVVRARLSLVIALRGGGKMGEKMFTSLGLVSQGEQRKRKNSASKPVKTGAR